MTTFLYFFNSLTVFIFFLIFFAVNPNISKGEETSEKPPDVISPAPQETTEDQPQPYAEVSAETEILKEAPAAEPVQ